MRSEDLRNNAATNPSASSAPSKTAVEVAASERPDRKQVVKLVSELNKLKKLEIKAEQRLLNHKQRFVAADWHRKRVDAGSERAKEWMGLAQSALNGWLYAANQLLVIASTRCLAEQELARLTNDRMRCASEPLANNRRK